MLSGALKMQDLENDGPGHFKADVVCIYAFCVVYNGISGYNEADITRSRHSGYTLTVSAAVAAAGGSTTAGWSLVSSSSSLSASAAA